MKKTILFCVLLLVLFSNVSFSALEYEVEKSINDEKFIINGEVYEAKTYCFNIDDGDKVIFTEGSAYGACASAEFIVVKTGNKCEVWCE